MTKNMSDTMHDAYVASVACSATGLFSLAHKACTAHAPLVYKRMEGSNTLLVTSEYIQLLHKISTKPSFDLSDRHWIVPRLSHHHKDQS